MSQKITGEGPGAEKKKGGGIFRIPMYLKPQYFISPSRAYVSTEKRNNLRTKLRSTSKFTDQGAEKDF